MSKLRTKSLVIILLLSPFITIAQQFIGLNTTDYSAISHMATNPAWVNTSENGMEVMLFSANALAGNNGYAFDRDFIFKGFNGQAIESKDYTRIAGEQNKHLWANIDINGPAVSFKYKDDHHFGVFTRVRQIYRGGNLTTENFALIGSTGKTDANGQPVLFDNAGFTTHTFAEVGFTYGRILANDYYNIIRGGFSIKYMMGFVAGSIYAPSLNYTANYDSLRSVQGNVNVNYTYNIGPYIDNNAQNDLTSWYQRAGRWGLGLDIGGQYEYHPNGNPNEPTPYLFSIAASITDIGSISYVADTGSGAYTLDINNYDTSILTKRDFEAAAEYMMKLEGYELLGNSEKHEKFRVGLPTALRINADYNAGDNFNLAVNMLLNMRGNSSNIYKPAYVSYINFTPTYGSRKASVSLPFTLLGYQTFTVGTIIRVGPFYIGSTSCASMFLTNRINNIDAYAGFVWKFRKNERHYY